MARKIARTVEECHDELDRADRHGVWIFVRLVYNSSQRVVLAADCHERYQLCFLCDTDIPYDNTWDRSGEVHRDDFQQRIEADLNSRGVQFTTLSGDLETRIDRVCQVLRQVEM